MSGTRVVVIGAGIVGLSTAYELLARGREVTVLDRAAVFDSASCGNAGLLALGHGPLTAPGVTLQALKWMLSRTSPLYLRPSLDPAYLRWLLRFRSHCNPEWLRACMGTLGAMGFPTLACLERYIDAEGIACHYVRRGWIAVCHEEAHFRAEREAAEAAGAMGYGHRVLDARETQDELPCLKPGPIGSVLWTDSAHIDPRAFMRQFAEAVERRGATLRTDATVVGVERDPSGRACGARLATGEVVRGDAVVLAAGAWSQELARGLGLDLTLQPARGYHMELDGVAEMPRWSFILSTTKVVATPMGDRLRLAGTLELGPLGRPWMRRRLEQLLVVARRHLRGLDAAQVQSEWAGYRPCTSDGMPLVGPSERVPGLFIGTGHAMMGMTLGPLSGQLLAQLICDERPGFDWSMLRPGRLGV